MLTDEQQAGTQREAEYKRFVYRPGMRRQPLTLCPGLLGWTTMDGLTHVDVFNEALRPEDIAALCYAQQPFPKGDRNVSNLDHVGDKPGN